MADRPRFFDDIAGVAGGAFSALSGLGEEIGAIVRARVDEALSALQLVRRDEFEVMSDLAAGARAAQEEADGRIAALETRLAALEARHAGGTAHGSAPAHPEDPTEPPEHDPHAADGALGGPPPAESTAGPDSEAEGRRGDSTPPGAV
ncbi:accessory factor UbiK family protein [Rhizosaccharibacter radicis]|uniref:accessory factor UbiK family protein n=1 Tax=Rhizosaccharibacter radicis TaxID=2782605 RepID=UPI003BF47D46